MCPGRPYILGGGKFSLRALPLSAVLARHLQGVGTATPGGDAALDFGLHFRRRRRGGQLGEGVHAETGQT
jgi:hypothetical protein